MKALTVVIYTCNRPNNVAILLTSLLSQSYQDFDVLIMEDGDPMNIMKWHEKFRKHFEWKGIKLDHMTKPNDMSRGIVHSRKLVHERINTEFVFDLNDDHLLDPSAIEMLMQGFGKGDPIGAVGSCTPFFGREYEKWTRVISTLKYSKLNKIALSDGKYSMTRDVDFIYVNNDGVKILEYAPVEHCSQMIYRRQLVTEFPEWYSPLGFTEETDISLQIRRAGYNLLFCTDAMNWHFQSENGIRSYDIEQLLKWQDEDFNKFVDKWLPWLLENGY